MYTTTSAVNDAPEFRATWFPPKDGREPRMHLAFGPELAVIVTLAELRQLAQVIEDAFQAAIVGGLDADA
jgi:hypothetical protein